MINIPKGTKDVLPSISYKWQYVESVAREICRLYNVREIRTPVFEHTELFLRSIGEETDVVSKEMYTFNDKGNRSITLKCEGTAPVARSYIENSLENLGLPLKMFYITPVFRYERPQAGRLREHHQFGVEMYGGAGAEYDFEVISLAYNLLTKLGITLLTLNLNSIGCANCRPKYNEALKDFLRANLSDLCPTCKERFEHNPLRTLDCKEEGCKNILKNAPRIIDFNCDECSAHLSKLSGLLTNAKIPFIINSNIVRGLDYYTRTVFEFVTNALGAQGTVCGGGRYNNLVESVGGKSTPCVGFGMGLERLIMLMDALNIYIADNTKPTVFIASISPEFAVNCINIVNDLRARGIASDLDCTGRSLKAQLKFADKQGSKYVVVIGGTEIENNCIDLKLMFDGSIIKCPIDKIYEYIK